MCVNRNILVVSLASLFVFCEVSYANRGEAVGQLMVKLGNALTQGGSKANALKAKSIRSKFLTAVKADHAEALRGLSRSGRGERGEFSGHILGSARQIKSGTDFKDMTAGIIQRIEERIQMAQKAANEHRLYGSLGNGFSQEKRGYISRGELDKNFEPMFRYLRRLRNRGNWPGGSIMDGYYSSSTHDLMYHSADRAIGLFPYSISKALGNVDDAIILRNKGSVSATEAFIKVFHSKDLLDVNSIHQMWFVVVKVFPNKTDGFLQDFVEVIF